MKKLIALVLVLSLMLGAVSALAEIHTETPPPYEDGTYSVNWWDDNGNYGSKYYAADGTLISSMDTIIDADTGTTVYGSKYYAADGTLISGMDKIIDADNGTTTSKYYNSDGELYESVMDNNTGTGNGVQYSADGSIEFVEGAIIDDGGNFCYVDFDPDGNVVYGYISGVYFDQEKGKWLNADGTEAEAPDVSAYWELAKRGLPQAAAKPKKPEAIWYSHNTAGVIGISLRDEYPDLTEKWYNVLPVDLSQDGTQTFQLVASNLYYIGSVSVTVAGDEVTTTYSFPTRYDRHIYPEDECLAWFTGVDQITGEFLENPTANAQFGTAISKEKDLNGQSSALLFVCNHVTYRMPLNDGGEKLVRFWRNHYKMADYFNNAKTLLEKVEAEHAEKKD